MKTVVKLLKFAVLFLLHLCLVTGGTLYGSFGMYALLSDSPLVAGVNTFNAVGTLLTGVVIAFASFMLTPRLVERVIK
jgi:hypothetical protein